MMWFHIFCNFKEHTFLYSLYSWFNNFYIIIFLNKDFDHAWQWQIEIFPIMQLKVQSAGGVEWKLGLLAWAFH